MKSLCLGLVALTTFTAGCDAQGAKSPIVELRIAITRSAAGYSPRRLADSTFYVSDSVLISDVDIQHADTSWSQGRLMIPVRLQPQAATRLADATRNHVGDRIAVFFDGEFTAAVIIVSAVNGPALMLEALDPPAGNRLAAEILARWPTRR